MKAWKWLPREDLLTYEELTRVARVCVEQFGFDSIRYHGAVSRPCGRTCRCLSDSLADLGVDLAMTTNGATLSHHAVDLARAGLAADQHLVRFVATRRFAAITNNGTLLRRCWPVSTLPLAAGLDPVKRQLRGRAGAQR